jgi:hypothetical protein
MKNHIKIIISGGLCVLIFFAFFILYYRQTALKGVSTSEVDVIYISNTNEGYAINKSEDIKEMLYVLKNMNLRKTDKFDINESNELYYSIYINLKDKSTITIGIFPQGIAIDDIYYLFDLESYHEVDKLYNKLYNNYPKL